MYTSRVFEDIIVSASGQNGESGEIPPHYAELKRSADNRPPEKNVERRLSKDLSTQDREYMVKRSNIEREARKERGQDETGQRELGQCKIGSQKRFENDTLVSFNKIGVPEKIETPTQTWERDDKNGRLWHVQNNGEKFDLKGDVRVVGDDIKAVIKYGNGREVTFKNGQPSEIQHPGGEKWTADPKRPGIWEVTAANAQDPEQPKHFSIQDVKVNPKDGDITWHVQQGAGKGHDREISSDNKYHDTPGRPTGELAGTRRQSREYVMRIGRIEPGEVPDAPKRNVPGQKNPGMEQRAEKARMEAALILPQIAIAKIEIPQQPEAAASRSLNFFPVPRAAVLGPRPEAAPLPVLPRAEQLIAQTAATPLPIELKSSQQAFQPLPLKSENYNVAAPAPVPIETHLQAAPSPVPVEIHHTQKIDAPAPVRATHTNEPMMNITPSIPKDQPPAAKTDSLPSKDSGAMQPQAAQTDLEHTQAVSQDSKLTSARPADAVTAPPPPNLFKFSATANASREHSVYDDGPKMVEDSTQKIQLSGNAQHDNLMDRVIARPQGGERAEQNALLDGEGLVRLANVGHKVPITVSGVRPNQGHYEATLNNPARGADGKELNNQVSWVSGRIEGSSFVIEQARINNGPVFFTLGVLPLKQRR